MRVKYRWFFVNVFNAVRFSLRLLLPGNLINSKKIQQWPEQTEEKQILSTYNIFVLQFSLAIFL